MDAYQNLAGGEPIESVYPTLDRDSVDRGLIEKAPHIRVVTGHFDWSDLGTWQAIGRSAPGSSVV